MPFIQHAPSGQPFRPGGRGPALVGPSFEAAVHHAPRMRLSPAAPTPICRGATDQLLAVLITIERFWVRRGCGARPNCWHARCTLCCPYQRCAAGGRQAVQLCYCRHSTLQRRAEPSRMLRLLPPTPHPPKRPTHPPPLP